MEEVCFWYWLAPDTSPPRKVQSIVITMSVCLLVCLSVHLHVSKTMQPNFTKFLCMSVAVVRLSSGDVVICYVLLVLWMVPCFHTEGHIWSSKIFLSGKSRTAITTASIPTKFCSTIKNSKCTSSVAHWREWNLLSTIALSMHATIWSRNAILNKILDATYPPPLSTSQWYLSNHYAETTKAIHSTNEM